MTPDTERRMTPRETREEKGHSPAPWRADDDIKVVDANGETVALVYPEDHREKRWYFECGKKNQRLIAASPALLAAVEDLIRDTEARDYLAGEPESEAMTKARAAVALVRGSEVGS